jgi:hypothetical protein
MKTRIILIHIFTLISVGCFGPHLNAKGVEVSGHIVLSKTWSIDFPEPFIARVETLEMVYRKPGFTCRMTVKGNPNKYSVVEQYHGIFNAKSPEVFDVKSEYKKDVIALSYRLHEQFNDTGVATYYGFVFSEAGYFKLVFYFDDESDVQLARTIHNSVTYTKP